MYIYYLTSQLTKQLVEQTDHGVNICVTPKKLPLMAYLYVGTECMY